MNKHIVKIQDEISDELKIFNENFSNSLKSNVSLLNIILKYVVKKKGKQMRPMFVFLTAKMFENFNENTYEAASLIELIHTATLVHDDIVDEAEKRRGFFTINKLWKNKIAVLIGDFLLSRALINAIQNEHFELLKHVSIAVKEMSEGELLQIEKSRKLDITEEIYYQIIKQKTASLIASCCACGAQSAQASKNDIETLRLFGEKVGMAFQIKDDLFDFGTYTKSGKPIGIDIKEKKITLPVILALKNTDKKTKKKILSLIKNHGNNSNKIQEVINFVINSEGINLAINKMNEFKNEAISLLENFDDNSAKEALVQLVEYTVKREK
jgi:octaprenyl-diphosphate synthase